MYWQDRIQDLFILHRGAEVPDEDASLAEQSDKLLFVYSAQIRASTGHPPPSPLTTPLPPTPNAPQTFMNGSNLSSHLVDTAEYTRRLCDLYASGTSTEEPAPPPEVLHEWLSVATLIESFLALASTFSRCSSTLRHVIMQRKAWFFYCVDGSPKAEIWIAMSMWTDDFCLQQLASTNNGVLSMAVSEAGTSWSPAGATASTAMHSLSTSNGANTDTPSFTPLNALTVEQFLRRFYAQFILIHGPLGVLFAGEDGRHAIAAGNVRSARRKLRKLKSRLQVLLSDLHSDDGEEVLSTRPAPEHTLEEMSHIQSEIISAQAVLSSALASEDFIVPQLRARIAEFIAWYFSIEMGVDMSPFAKWIPSAEEESSNVTRCERLRATKSNSLERKTSPLNLPVVQPSASTAALISSMNKEIPSIPSRPPNYGSGRKTAPAHKGIQPCGHAIFRTQRAIKEACSPHISTRSLFLLEGDVLWSDIDSEVTAQLSQFLHRWELIAPYDESQRSIPLPFLSAPCLAFQRQLRLAHGDWLRAQLTESRCDFPSLNPSEREFLSKQLNVQGSLLDMRLGVASIWPGRVLDIDSLTVSQLITLPLCTQSGSVCSMGSNSHSLLFSPRLFRSWRDPATGFAASVGRGLLFYYGRLSVVVCLNEKEIYAYRREQIDNFFDSSVTFLVSSACNPPSIEEDQTHYEEQLKSFSGENLPKCTTCGSWRCPCVTLLKRSTKICHLVDMLEYNANLNTYSPHKSTKEESLDSVVGGMDDAAKSCSAAQKLRGQLQIALISFVISKALTIDLEQSSMMPNLDQLRTLLGVPDATHNLVTSQNPSTLIINPGNTPPTPLLTDALLTTALLNSNFSTVPQWQNRRSLSVVAHALTAKSLLQPRAFQETNSYKAFLFSPKSCVAKVLSTDPSEALTNLFGANIVSRNNEFCGSAVPILHSTCLALTRRGMVPSLSLPCLSLIVQHFGNPALRTINDVWWELMSRRTFDIGFQSSCVRVSTTQRGGVWVIGRAINSRLGLEAHIVVITNCATLNDAIVWSNQLFREVECI